MTPKELAEKVFPDTEVEIKGKKYPYTPSLQRDGFIKGLEQLRNCWVDAQYEMHLSFSSRYVSKTFDKWIEETFNK